MGLSGTNKEMTILIVFDRVLEFYSHGSYFALFRSISIINYLIAGAENNLSR
jgi:hypothetical protein